MEFDNKIRFKKFFDICFKIQSKHNGKTTVENAKRYIGLEFGLASDGEATERYYQEMLQAKFLTLGINGVIINWNLEENWQKYLKKFNMI